MKIRLYFFTLLMISLFVFGTNAQEKGIGKPELTVAGFELGNRQKAKEFLENRYSPRPGEDGHQEYYFYNEFGTEVMRVVSKSKDDPHFITEIEVFSVGRSYLEKHFYLKDTSYFVTENGIFIGYRQSVSSMFLFPGVTRRDVIGSKDVVSIKGEPASRTSTEKNREVFVYEIPNVKIAGEKGVFKYEARYEFYKKKLKKFKLKIIPAKL